MDFISLFMLKGHVFNTIECNGIYQNVNRLG